MIALIQIILESENKPTVTENRSVIVWESRAGRGERKKETFGEDTCSLSGWWLQIPDCIYTSKVTVQFKCGHFIVYLLYLDKAIKGSFLQNSVFKYDLGFFLKVLYQVQEVPSYS